MSKERDGEHTPEAPTWHSAKISKISNRTLYSHEKHLPANIVTRRPWSGLHLLCTAEEAEAVQEEEGARRRPEAEYRSEPDPRQTRAGVYQSTCLSTLIHYI